MPEPVTVWKVELARGAEPIDVEGTLSLADDALVFEDETGVTSRIAFADIERARRLRISSVLVIDRRDRTAAQIAFYFAQPPPLHPPDPATLSLRESTRRKPSKRRHHRDNTGYLAGSGTRLKPTVQAWVEEVRAKVEASKRPSGA